MADSCSCTASGTRWTGASGSTVGRRICRATTARASWSSSGRHSKRGEGIFEGATTWTTTGRLWGAPLLSVQGRRPSTEAEATLALDTYEVTATAHVLTNLPGVHAVTAWRLYNQGAVVEQRIRELGQLACGRTAVDDPEGNALLWSLGTLVYQLLHALRTTALRGRWRRAQPDRVRTWIFRLPAKVTRHARKLYLQLLRTEPVRQRLLRGLRRLGRAPPLLPTA